MGNRAAVPRLAGAERVEAAVNIAALAAEKCSDPQIAKRLGYTADQIRRVREEYGIKPGQPIEKGRPQHGGRPRRPRGDCATCGRDCALDRFGLVGPHRQELVSRFGALAVRRYGTWCEGRGEKPDPIEIEGDN